MIVIRKITMFLMVILICFSCSDFDEQDFTVLLPDAGEDIVLFTEEICISATMGELF